jgi:hypothetical protein
MSPTRREFLKGLGLAMASLVLTGCVPFGEEDSSARGRLRKYWLQLEDLAETTQKDFEKGEGIRSELLASHQAALNELTATGELDAAAAEQVQAAFVEATYHVWRANAPITCYEPMIVNYKPASADQLVKQANLLAEMAQSGELDANTVAQAQAAIERDVAFLGLSGTEIDALYETLRQAAGDSYTYPAFDELELAVSPETAEAARFLVTLLTQQD